MQPNESISMILELSEISGCTSVNVMNVVMRDMTPCSLLWSYHHSSTTTMRNLVTCLVRVDTVITECLGFSIFLYLKIPLVFVYVPVLLVCELTVLSLIAWTFNDIVIYCIFLSLARKPLVAQGVLICRGFMTTLRFTTLVKNPLEERSARRKDLHMITHNTHKRQTSMPSGSVDLFYWF